MMNNPMAGAMAGGGPPGGMDSAPPPDMSMLAAMKSHAPPGVKHKHRKHAKRRTSKRKKH